MTIRRCVQSSSLPWLVMSLLALSGCHAASVEEVATTAAVPVVVEDARIDTLQSLITASGTVVPAPGAEQVIVAPGPARIAEMPKAEGDAVRQGDLLVRFDIPTLAADVAARRAALAQASARVEAAKASFNRLSSLVTQGVAAPREVEDAKRIQAEAEADVAQSQIAVDAALSLETRSVVRAQFSGVVSKRLHNVGDLVDAASSDPVLRVINPAQLQVVAAVPVGQLSKIIPGHAAQVFEPGQQAGEPARVLTKAPQVDPNIATADVRLTFLKPGPLAAGTLVQVEIVGEEHSKALVIPAAAVVNEEGETFVMVVGSDNKAHKYPIAIGLATHKLVEITSGLKPGDKVVVRGQEGLPEGAAVTVQK